MNKETKDQIAREAAQQAIIVENRFKGKNVDYGIIVSQVGGFEAGYIAGAETWAERGEVLKEALEKLNKELDYYWNSSRTISSRKSMPETIKRAICAAQKECAQALSNYNNYK